MSVLFSRLPGTDGAGIWFIARSNEDVEIVSPADLGSVSADRVVVLVPGTEVFLATVTAATRSLADLRTAALYQLEDDLSQPVNELHLAVGQRDGADQNTRNVAVVSRSAMAVWNTACEALPDNIKERFEFIPETSLFLDGEPFVFDGDERAIVFDGQKSWACDPSMAADIVPALLQHLELQDVALLSAQGAVLRPADTPENRFGTSTNVLNFASFAAPHLLEGAGINLLQADFSRKNASNVRLGGWSSTFWLAAAALLIWIFTLGVSVFGLNRASDDLYQSMVTAYARAFPDQGRVVDPSREVSLRLRNAPGRDGVSFVGLTAALYSGLSDVEGVALQGLTYDRSTGRITASLQFAGYEARDQLRDSFESRGLVLELGGARQEGGIIVGEASLGGQP